VSELTAFALAVHEVVAGIPAGDVMTYAEVAAEAGHPGAARGVGAVMRASKGLPWWRVVNSSLRISTDPPGHQADMLRIEGWNVDPITHRLLDH
jgi:methylated-DNA-protein-cysteine methyltransferase-like protein